MTNLTQSKKIIALTITLSFTELYCYSKIVLSLIYINEIFIYWWRKAK
ncbi:MAG: hypothetical protein Ta2G_17930 [Termitinemataceae bacterium]|nr:MAG: hypothetical protein Ta2G_17930 [Termitinemataceae bacterium]